MEKAPCKNCKSQYLGCKFVCDEYKGIAKEIAEEREQARKTRKKIHVPKRMKGYLPQRACKNCLKWFLGYGEFCSYKCEKEYKNKNLGKRKCWQCGVEFQPEEVKDHFCSVNCRASFYQKVWAKRRRENAKKDVNNGNIC